MFAAPDIPARTEPPDGTTRLRSCIWEGTCSSRTVAASAGTAPTAVYPESGSPSTTRAGLDRPMVDAVALAAEDGVGLAGTAVVGGRDALALPARDFLVCRVPPDGRAMVGSR